MGAGLISTHLLEARRGRGLVWLPEVAHMLPDSCTVILPFFAKRYHTSLMENVQFSQNRSASIVTLQSYRI